MNKKSEKRNDSIRVRLTPEEFDKLEEVARKTRRTKSEVVRIGLDMVFATEN